MIPGATLCLTNIRHAYIQCPLGRSLRPQLMDGVLPAQSTQRLRFNSTSEKNCKSRHVSLRGQMDDEKQAPKTAFVVVPPALIATVGLVAVIQPPALLYDIVYGPDWGFPLGASEISAAALWSVSLWFASPWQLLLLFLGKIETERPSDFIMNAIASVAGLDKDALDYAPPPPVVAAAVVFTVASGAAITVLCDALFQDSSWALSTGIGSLVAAAVYEVGRPPRLSPEEAMELDAQWQVFAGWAEGALERSGQCHESEIFKAFRTTPGVRSAGVTDEALRDMVRNFHPGVKRTSQGFYKGLKVKPRVDPFTGAVK